MWCPFIFNIVLQVLDGVFTYIGVLHYGIEIEGNPLVRNTFLAIGAAPTLLLFKGSAIVVVSVLKKVSNAPLTRRLMGFVNLVYCVSAMLWVYVLVETYRW
jgi:hypothetical protein